MLRHSFIRRTGVSAVLAVILLVSPGRIFGAYAINHPLKDDSFSKNVGNISADGTANSGDVITCRIKGSSGSIQSNFNYTLGPVETTWSGQLAPPSGGWLTTLNPNKCELVVGGAVQVTVTGITFTFP